VSINLEVWRALVRAESLLNRAAMLGSEEARSILRHYPTPSRAAKLCNVEDEHEYREFCQRQEQSWREGLGL
jgi:hypothetical protein